MMRQLIIYKNCQLYDISADAKTVPSCASTALPAAGTARELRQAASHTAAPPGAQQGMCTHTHQLGRRGEANITHHNPFSVAYRKCG